MSDWQDEPVIREEEFEPDAEVFRIWVSKKERNGTRDGQPVRISYWEGAWDIPRSALAPDDKRKRPQITASSPTSAEEAERRCREKVLAFWLNRAQALQREVYQQQPARLSKEERAAGYTVQSFLEEYVASRTNPNTAAQNRWRPGTERNNRTMLRKWVYEFLGDVPLTQLTHRQVREHFTQVLPSQLDDNDQRIIGDSRIKGVYSVFKAGLRRASNKGLLESGEFLDIGLQMQFEPAGIPEDIEDLMWAMEDLLARPEVIADPDAVRWALAYGQGLRRGERAGLAFGDLDLVAGEMTVQRQLSYIPGQPDFLDPRLKSGAARTIVITDLTLPYLVAATERREQLIEQGWKAERAEFADLILLRDDGVADRLNHDNELFGQFCRRYGLEFPNLSPGALRHAAATYWANHGGPDGRGVSREQLRKFMGHAPGSKLDDYYARSSRSAMRREFSPRRSGASLGTGVPGRTRQ